MELAGPSGSGFTGAVLKTLEVDSFRLHARALPEVIGVYHVTGANDFLVHVVVRDAAHLRELAVSGFTTLPEVAHIETSLIFEHGEAAALPDLTAVPD